MSSINNGQFSRNVLAVGKTGCGKAHFPQKLGLNKFFSNLVKTEWVSGIDIDEEREAEMQSCFTNKTVCKKYRYHCIYVFHIIAPEGQIWKKVLSQTNIFNIFPSSVPCNTVAKILQSNCRQTTKKYAPACSVWLDRVFADLANTDEWHCLTIDCSGINKNGPGRYRTQADDPEKQVCCFNKPRDDALYNVFISNRMKTENFSNEIYFKLDGVQGKDETFDAKQTLK